MSAPAHRFGVVALFGPPNAGKSTLLNALVGAKVSAVAPRPNTTRLRVSGVATRPGWQALLTDTPGLVAVPAGSEQHLLGRMRRAAGASLAEADLGILVASPDTQLDEALLAGLSLKPAKLMVAVNKADADPAAAEALRARLEAELKPSGSLVLSARRKENLAPLELWLAARLPEGEAQYGEDEITLMTLRELAPELIREKALLHLDEEVPHSLAVGLESYHERGDGLHHIQANLYVEREAQKGIVIGKGGAMLKRIGSSARQDLEALCGAKVHLELWVKVRKHWKKDRAFLAGLGYEG